MSDKATDVYLTLNNGKKIPALGLGTVPPENHPEAVKDQVITAVKAGYRHIDTAWFYGSEKYIGQALQELFKEGVVKREDMFITTKVWPSYYHSPEKSIDESLKELQLDYADLVLQHWPICLHGDENGLPAIPRDKDGKLQYDDDPTTGTKFIEVYNKLESLVDSTTKVKSVGVSNYSIEKLKQLLPHIKSHKPVVNQIEYHPQLPQQDLVSFCEENGILIECYSPVGSNGAPVLKLPLIKSLAEKHNCTVNEIATAYHILQGRIVLPRSSNLERIRTTTGLPRLTKEELKELYAIGEANPKRHINDEWGYGLGFDWWEGDSRSGKYPAVKENIVGLTNAA